MSRDDFDRAIRRAESPELWWGGAPAAEREAEDGNEEKVVTMDALIHRAYRFYRQKGFYPVFNLEPGGDPADLPGRCFVTLFRGDEVVDCTDRAGFIFWAKRDGILAGDARVEETNKEGGVTMETEKRGMEKTATMEHGLGMWLESEVSMTLKMQTDEAGYSELENAVFVIENMALALEFVARDEFADAETTRVIFACTQIIKEKTGAVRSLIREADIEQPGGETA